MQVGERRLLPKVREASDDTLIVADGFSCHGQIETAERKALHVAQVLQMAIREKRAEPRESRIATRRLRMRRALKVAALAGVVAFAVSRI